VRLRTVALPVEHGAWGFLLEPALLGLLVAWSSAGVALVIAGLAAIVLQTPLSLALSDVRRRRVYPRTGLAWRFVALYGVILGAAVAVAIVLAGTPAILVPALIAVPLALGQLWFDAHGRSREFAPEVLGALAIGSLAACIAVAAGWSIVAALGLWALLAARSVPTIAYVRARLRLERGHTVDPTRVWAMHLLALALVAVAVAFTDLAWLVLVPYVALAGRAALGVSRLRVSVPAKVIGFRELGFGVALVALLALVL